MRILAAIPLLLLTSGCMMAARAAIHPHSADPVQLLRRADTNGDGAVTRTEFAAMRERLFAKLDRNHDGYLTADDQSQRRLRRRGSGEKLQQAMQGLDRDGDGRVSRDEFVNGPTLMFDRADTDGDGTISPAELDAFAAKVKERHAAQ